MYRPEVDQHHYHNHHPPHVPYDHQYHQRGPPRRVPTGPGPPTPLGPGIPNWPPNDVRQQLPGRYWPGSTPVLVPHFQPRPTFYGRGMAGGAVHRGAEFRPWPPPHAGQGPGGPHPGPGAGGPHPGPGGPTDSYHFRCPPPPPTTHFYADGAPHMGAVHRGGGPRPFVMRRGRGGAVSSRPARGRGWPSRHGWNEGFGDRPPPRQYQSHHPEVELKQQFDGRMSRPDNGEDRRTRDHGTGPASELDDYQPSEDEEQDDDEDRALQGPADPTPKKKNGMMDDDVTHRERLTDEMVRGNYECMVCCDVVRPSHEIWSCHNCYHTFHLRCIKKWARSPAASVDGFGWRCPGCQNVTDGVPRFYMCFCGRTKNPEWNRYDTPHSCGDQCGKKRPQEACNHSCNLLCHPGPCPPCGIYVTKECFCGQETKKVNCGQIKSFSCGRPCQETLACGIHSCPDNCHAPPCNPCDQIVQRSCFGGHETKDEPCTRDTTVQPRFSCGKACDRPLDCGTHTCQLTCHDGDCPECPLSPNKVTSCPCGQTDLRDLLGPDQARKNCTDPIPVCGKTCDKVLQCGPKDVPHQCQATCHEGQCPPCPLTSFLRCRCGFLEKELPCPELLGDQSPAFTCGKRCNKKKTCGRHKCSQTCCVDTQHRCALACGRKLSCGLHQCDEACHLGNCHPCWNTSFEELACHCGATVRYPPVPCGTKPPECNRTCTRAHACDHQVTHNCHSEPQCPPCTSLTSKWCYGQHKLRTCIPCYQTNVCCGLPCNKPLPCKQHLCAQTCHEGPCYTEGFQCVQPCPRPKPQCGHPCGAPCHEGDCPQLACKVAVAVTCKCGHRTGTQACADNEVAFQRLISSMMASKHHATEQGQTLDITEVMKDGGIRKTSTLNCTEECAQIERNRRMALALQIRNPELTSKLKPPTYSDFLREQMKANETLVTSVYNRLTELVQSAKQSKTKSRSHAFPAMKSDHRRVIHELAEFFGCETQSYDEEPKKNVVATAFRDKSWLPSTSIMAVMQENRKAPPPVPHHCQRNNPLSQPGNTTFTSAAISDTAKATSVPATDQGQKTSKPPSAQPIDYFDYTE